LNDDFTESSKIKELEERFSFICQFDLPDTLFQPSGVKSFKTKIMLFYANSEHLEKVPFSNVKTQVSLTDEGADFVYRTYLQAHMEKKKALKTRLFYEALQGNVKCETAEFVAKIQKYLFHIKRSPKTQHLYAECLQYVDDYKNQNCPDGMRYEDWVKIRKTPESVLCFLKNALTSQNKAPERDVIELVKSKHSFRLKARSAKMENLLERSCQIKETTISEMVYKDEYTFEDDR